MTKRFKYKFVDSFFFFVNVKRVLVCLHTVFGYRLHISSHPAPLITLLIVLPNILSTVTCGQESFCSDDAL